MNAYYLKFHFEIKVVLSIELFHRLHIDRLIKQTKDKKTLEGLKKVDKSLTEWAKKSNHSLEARTKNMKGRDKKVVTKTFHKAGIVVPLDSTGVGYRELPETDGNGLDSFLI